VLGAGLQPCLLPAQPVVRLGQAALAQIRPPADPKPTGDVLITTHRIGRPFRSRSTGGAQKSGVRCHLCSITYRSLEDAAVDALPGRALACSPGASSSLPGVNASIALRTLVRPMRGDFSSAICCAQWSRAVRLTKPGGEYSVPVGGDKSGGGR
jgi:hypothetical protein